MIEAKVLTVDEAAAVLGISPQSVRVTMNRQGYGELRGYNEADVLAVRDGRQRRRRPDSTTASEETP